MTVVALTGSSFHVLASHEPKTDPKTDPKVGNARAVLDCGGASPDCGVFMFGGLQKIPPPQGADIRPV